MNLSKQMEFLEGYGLEGYEGGIIEVLKDRDYLTETMGYDIESLMLDYLEKIGVEDGTKN